MLQHRETGLPRPPVARDRPGEAVAPAAVVPRSPRPLRRNTWSGWSNNGASKPEKQEFPHDDHGTRSVCARSDDRLVLRYGHDLLRRRGGAAQSRPAATRRCRREASRPPVRPVNPLARVVQLTDIDRKREFAKQVVSAAARTGGLPQQASEDRRTLWRGDRVVDARGARTLLDFEVTSDGPEADKHHYDLPLRVPRT